MRAHKEELSAFAALERLGRERMLTRGFEQWDSGFVSDESAAAIIDAGEAMLILNGEIPVAAAQFSLACDPDYDASGIFPEREYLAVHRVSGDSSLLAHPGDAVFAFAGEYALGHGRASIFIDTSPENIAMQRCLARNGFSALGEFRLLNGAVRLGYARPVNNIYSKGNCYVFDCPSS